MTNDYIYEDPCASNYMEEVTVYTTEEEEDKNVSHPDHYQGEGGRHRQYGQSEADIRRRHRPCGVHGRRSERTSGGARKNRRDADR